MAIGALLFATLVAVRRKEPVGGKQVETSTAVTGSPPIDEQPKADAISDGEEHAAAYEALAGDAAVEESGPETLDEPAMTPEWEPHAAARVSPEQGAPDITPDTGEPIGDSEAPPDDIWAEPTPTAMSDAAALDAGSEGVEDDAGSFSSFLDDEPVATRESQTETSATSDVGPAADAPMSEDDVPEEEPFERAGRWWFKRGSELLVYNEQSGEWVPSPTPLPQTEQPAPGRFGSEPSAIQTISELTAAEPEQTEDEAAPGLEEPGLEEPALEESELVEPTGQQGFWKCPSCGAVNGSTATTCRMCFAARPAPGAETSS